VFRAVFIAAGSVLIASFAWILYVFGGFLVLTGIRMARHRAETVLILTLAVAASWRSTREASVSTESAP
jgi:predicted tellurium resistance membrane protein TerC